MRRVIPTASKVVWSVEAALFVLTLFTSSWWIGLATLVWFGVFEAVGVATSRPGDTLSESIWKLLDVRDHAVGNKAFYPLVMGVFVGAGVLFVGLVAGAGGFVLHRAYPTVAAGFVAAGVVAFLFRHFRRGDSR